MTIQPRPNGRAHGSFYFPPKPQQPPRVSNDPLRPLPRKQDIRLAQIVLMAPTPVLTVIAFVNQDALVAFWAGLAFLAGLIGVAWVQWAGNEPDRKKVDHVGWVVMALIFLFSIWHRRHLRRVEAETRAWRNGGN